MSVINQVLNQLEQRGAPPIPQEAMVRVVPRGKQRLLLPLLAVALALAGGIAAWQWIQMRKHVLNSVEGPKTAVVSTPPQRLTVAAMPASAVSVPAVAVAATAPVAVATPPVEIPPPASRLSFELSSIALPSSLRELQSGVRPNVADAAATNAAPLAHVPEPQPISASSPNMRAAAQPSGGVSPMKHVSPAQQADAEFRKAVMSMQQGHIADAMAGYEAALHLDSGHDAARQALVALLLESKRVPEAGRVLQERLRNKPEHTGFAMLLARLQVEQGAVEQATATLEKSLPYADTQADYQAFFAALLQRQNRHKEAITHYEIALQLAPGKGIWLMGYGISLQAVQRSEDARDAYRRALESQTLSPELQAFVQQKLRGL